MAPRWGLGDASPGASWGQRLEAPTLGEAWLSVAEALLAQGVKQTYDGAPTIELELVTLSISEPRSDDPLIAELGDPERLSWMQANFTGHALVSELGMARSYASRLYDYGGAGRDQVQWVIERLRADPGSRSATITMLEPLLDSSYIPCVSLLDFWLRERRLAALVYAHSIDFGTKGYGNLVQIASLMERIAAALHVPVGRLDFIVKSAHIYERDITAMRAVVASRAPHTKG
jgi:thymidylate synthase